MSNFTDMMTPAQKKLWEELTGIWKSWHAAEIEIRLHQSFRPGWKKSVNRELHGRPRRRKK